MSVAALGTSILAALTLLAWLAYLIDAVRHRDEVVRLQRIDPPGEAQRRRLPPASVVVAARNEEAGVEDGIGSLLRLDYPDLEIIAVDDRSEDRTGEILDRMAGRNDRLEVIHVEELPPGWLGKNHALQVGADAAGGEILLFTDADVVMERTLLGRAVECLVAEGLDHLPVAGIVESRSAVVELFVLGLGVVFSGFLRPWKAADPDSDVAVGIGAFNLVRREAYERAGEHEAIRMRPDDDLCLGERIKESGGRQRFGAAGELLRVEWYRSLGEAVRGLEKNSFAAVDYQPVPLVVGTVATFLLGVWPFLALAVVSGVAWWINGLVCVLAWVLAGTFVVQARLPAWTVPLLPVGILLLQYATLRAAWITYRDGGIRWRGTFYPLEELRRGDSGRGRLFRS